MSEVVWSSRNIALPQGYEKLDGVEIVKQKDETLRFNGLLELGLGNDQSIRRAQLPDPLEMWGYNPESRQSAKAMALINDQEMPVTVIGIAGRKGDEIYYRTQESDTGIEAGKIKWLKEDKDDPKDSAEITRLKADLSNLRAEKDTIEAERDELKSRLEELQGRFNDLEAIVDRIQKSQGIEDPENPPTDIEEGQTVQTIINGQVIEATVLGEPFYRNNKWHYRVRTQNGLILEPSSEELNQWQGIDVPPPGPIPPAGVRPPRPRRTDYFAFWRPRGVVERRPVHRDGVATGQAEDVFIRESDTSRRGRIGAVIVSVLALAGIGYTLHEVEEIEHRQAKPTRVEQFLEQQNSILQKKVERIGIQETKQLHRQRVILANQEDIKQKLDTLHIHTHKYGNNILNRTKDLQVREKKENKQEAHRLGGSAEYHARQNAELSYRGDTVWNEVSKRVREKLGYQANVNKVKKATDYVLRLNGLRWSGGGYRVDAHKLPVGFRFKIPDNIDKIVS